MFHLAEGSQEKFTGHAYNDALPSGKSSAAEGAVPGILTVPA
jgi:hypothetical protein